MVLWALRLVWATLPLTAGPAAADALTEWTTGLRVTAAVLVWAGWAIALLATFAPRPVGLTALRAIAPAFVVVAIAIVVAGTASDVAGAGAIVATATAAALASRPETAVAAANGVAYGDEQRFPLRIPPALFLGPLPLARAVVVGGAVAGPLLLADGRVALGVAVLVVGVPLAALSGRSLHALSTRWVVLVPAGVVVVDQMTLADAVLFVRERIRSLRAVDGVDPAPPDALDLRLGATAGSVVLGLDREADLVRRRARRGGDTVRGASVLVAVVRPATLLRAAARRRVRVEVR